MADIAGRQIIFRFLRDADGENFDSGAKRGLRHTFRSRITKVDHSILKPGPAKENFLSFGVVLHIAVVIQVVSG